MELEDRVFKMIDEELEILEKAIDELKKDNELKKVDISKKEIFLEQLENLRQDNM